MIAALLAVLLCSPPAVSAAASQPAVDKSAPKARRKNRRGKPKPAGLSLDALLAPATAQAPAPSTAPAAPPPPPPPPPAIVPVLDVVWPKEGDSFPFVTRSFTFGRANPGATLAINGQAVQVLPSGAFFAMVPFSTGTFGLDYQSRLTGISVSTRRVVNVAPAFGPEPPEGYVLALEPDQDIEALPGELVVARCKGPPGGTAEFSVGKVARELPMAESQLRPGLYEGHVYLPGTDRDEPQEVHCRVKAKGGGKSDAPGKVTVLSPLRSKTGVVVGRNAILKSSEQGYSLFPPAGTRLEITGRRGGLLRVRLSESDEAWIDPKSVVLLADGAPPPRAIVGRYITTRASDRAVRVTVSASERVAYEVRQSVEPLGYEVRFFNSRQRFDRMHFAPEDGVVSGIRWRQESAGVVRLNVDTELSWGWGYASGYDESGNFYLEIRRPPDLTKGDNVLAGRRVVVDAGHGPEMSAVGPLGTTERDVNLAIAGALEGLLLAEGAEVYMIRRSSDGPGLAERPWLAYEAKGDAYVSIHNNALPVTADPAETPRGYMHFYYHPQSRRLAEAVTDAYRKRHPELADEGLRWGDLAVCRGTFMPAILTESAYVILPEQEERLRRTDYQKRLAGTILEGLRDWLKDYQRVQRRSASERRAAGAR